MVEGLGVRVSSSWFRGWGLRFGVRGVGVGVWGSGFWMSGVGCDPFHETVSEGELEAPLERRLARRDQNLPRGGVHVKRELN